MKPHENPTELLYSAAHVCAAAGISYDTLKNWTAKSPAVIVMDHPLEERPGRGGVVRYSFQRALHIALTAELGRLGLPLKRASAIALNFTDMGDVDLTVGPLREVGKLYKQGSTFLLHFAGTEVGVVVNTLDDSTLCAAANMCGLTWGHAFVVLPVDHIFNHVSRVLAAHVSPGAWGL